MTPLSLTEPLASLLDASGLTYKALGALRKPPVGQPAVSHAVRLGDRVELSTLALYARAAGYKLHLGVDGARYTYATDDLDVTVAGARTLLTSLGLEMTLAVEPQSPAASTPAPTGS